MSFWKNLFSKSTAPTILGKTEKELQEFFDQRIIDQSSTDQPSYSKFSIFSVEAYAMDFLIQNNQLNLVGQVLNKNGVILSNVNDVFTANNNGRKIIGRISDLFGGKRVQLLTNNHQTLNEIQKQETSPPPPWVALPYTKAEWWGGSSQGDAEFYRETYFDRFFTGISEQRKEKYFKEINASSSWIKAIRNWSDLNQADEDYID